MSKSNESEKHAMMNTQITAVLKSRGWVVRCEEMHADITTFLPGRCGVWVIESERRANSFWIKRNVFRNERNGAKGIVIVAETVKVEKKLRHIMSSLPQTIRNKVEVVVIEDFKDEFVQQIMERMGK